MPRHFMTTAITRFVFFATAISCCLTLFARMTSAEDASNWPQWRGAAQNGVAAGSEFPKQWSETSGILWKTELAGLGGSTPVIDGKTAYLTAGIDGNNTLMAVDVESGDVTWKIAAGRDRGNKHRKGSGSNPSAVIDGDLVFAYYRSGDLVCVNKQGDIQWQTNLQETYGEDTLWWDLGSSPMLTKTAVVVAVMQSGPSYLVAFDKQSGDRLWKTDRMLGAPEEAAQSYATPLAVTVNGKDAIAVMGADHLTLHSAADGKELGRLGGFNPDNDKFFRSISSPVAEGNIIVCPYSRGGTITAVDINALAGGKGKDAILWHRDDLGSDVPTPAALNGRIYVVGDKANGLISCLDIKTGDTLWKVQLPKSRLGFSSSPLVAGNFLYVTQENATTYVIGPLDADQPDVVATNKVADDQPFTVASPAPAGNSLLIRSRNYLYRIAAK
jgi:outer membrane protein assembly factor BamB